ncbi:glycolate oxidase [Catenulispora sp. MAP12-49]|uniref:FAD-linked oxidase C-terminal domain-containing protein n=1 Tax=Catenulispora sp. MAP12-49 TaxID=3156302 RepID=UPI0035186295
MGRTTQTDRRQALAAVLADVTAECGPALRVLSGEAERRAYETDALTAHRVLPGLVLLPADRSQVAPIVRACVRHGVPYVARGAGTGLSGGALPAESGVVIALAKLNRILDVDPDRRVAIVEPGATNLSISAAAGQYGLYYAPDPSSQVVCTIGGNVAENSGGAHCLKYGFTSHHVLAVETVLPDGSVAVLGSDDIEAPCYDAPGYDLRGVFVGAEGTCGVATRIAVRLLRRPEVVRTLVADFPDVPSACETVSAVIAAGIVPAAIEMMDNLAIRACEDAVHAGYDREAAASLIIELDGPAEECAEQFEHVSALCSQHACTRLRIAADDAERAAIWAGRKAAFAAMGRLSPEFLLQDGVVPRTRLAEALAGIADLSAAAGLRVANVFHAGDGNLHPLVLYRAADGQGPAAETLAADIAELCVALGGSLSGEHGIGVDKACSMPKMFSPADLTAMDRLRAAFDPSGLCNPGKVFPTPALCGEARAGAYQPHPLEETGKIQRW